MLRHINKITFLCMNFQFLWSCNFLSFLSNCRFSLWRAAMMKTGATKVGLPKPGLQERARQGSLTHTSSSATSTAMKTSRSSNTLASDQRLSRVSHMHTIIYIKTNIIILDMKSLLNLFKACPEQYETVVAGTNSRCVSSWKEPTATMHWRSLCWGLLPRAPAWRRLWPLEPSQILQKAALAVCLVGDLPPWNTLKTYSETED